MPTLSETLYQVLETSDVLPPREADAISGNDVWNRIKDKIQDAKKETVLSYLSQMSKDRAGPIAKRAGKQGYYFRPRSERLDQIDVSEADAIDGGDRSGDTRPRGEQPEEKFRAIFSVLAEQEQEVFSKPIEHTAARHSRAGINKWKYPDVVLVRWDGSLIDIESGELSKEMLAVRLSSGDSPFCVESVELKVSIAASDLRKVFFQCVSNSRWANRSTLAIACVVDDESVQAELQRLGPAYGINVVSYSLDRMTIESLQPADQLRSQGVSGELLKEIQVTQIASVPDRDSLDWSYITDMRGHHDEFRNIFKWLAHCLEEKRVRSYGGWQRLLSAMAEG